MSEAFHKAARDSIAGDHPIGMVPARTGIRTSKLEAVRVSRRTSSTEADHPPPSERLSASTDVSPNHDGVSELKGRSDVPQILYGLTGSSNCHRTEIATRPRIDWLTSTLSILAMLISVVSRCTSPVL